MDLDLTPKLAKQLHGGDGGSYYAWCPNELPMLKEGNIGGAKLALSKNGFALPRYSDSAKVAYVLQGKIWVPCFWVMIIIWGFCVYCLEFYISHLGFLLVFFTFMFMNRNGFVVLIYGILLNFVL